MKRLLLPLLLVVVLLLAAAGTSNSGIFTQYFSASAPHVKLRPTEAIYGFTLDTTGAVILRMKVPVLWNVKIDNSDGDRSRLRATAIVGAWAFRGEDLDYFKDFVEIGKEDPNRSPPPPPFDVKLTLTITDDETGKQRKVVLPINQITLSRRSEP